MDMLGGALNAVISALGSALYFKGKMEGDLQAMKNSVAEFKAEQNGMSAACHRQKEEILAELRREVQGIVRLAVAESSLKHSEQMGEIRSNIATIVALNGEMQKDVEGIYNRLNRRSSTLPHEIERRE